MQNLFNYFQNNPGHILPVASAIAIVGLTVFAVLFILWPRRMRGNKKSRDKCPLNIFDKNKGGFRE